MMAYLSFLLRCLRIEKAQKYGSDLYKKGFQTGKSGYTLAYILLFDKDETIISVLPYHKTDAIYRVKQLNRYDDREVIKCNLLESFDKLMIFIEKHVDERLYLEGTTRVNARNNLFRKVIANLLIHREYSNSYPAKLIIEKDCVKTENGNNAHGFGVIDPNNFTPYPKNPTIVAVFKEIGWADELGSGVKNVTKYSKVYSNITPEFIDGDVFKTIVYIDDEKNKYSQYAKR